MGRMGRGEELLLMESALIVLIELAGLAIVKYESNTTGALAG